jgi:hypothetical protein
MAATGMRVPMLDDEPRLTMRQTLAFVAWRDLCGERSIGYGPGPIPWRAMLAWCDRYEVSDAEFFIEVVQAIDVEWLSDATAAAKSQRHPRQSHGEKGDRSASVRGIGREGT